MSLTELLKRVVAVLDEVGIEYMVTGSLASSLQGEPRTTHGIDLVVRILAEQVPALIRSFPSPRYYLSEEAAREAIELRGRFNLLEASEGDSVDFWLPTDDPFDRSRFSRKYVEEVLGLTLNVSRPEDTIIQKLKWVVASGGSEKAFTDALHVYEVQHGALDLGYIEEWARRVAVAELWDKVKAEAEPM